MNFKFFTYISLFLIIFTAQAFAELTAEANHDHINIDFFYHGSTVSVSGISDPDVDLIIKMTSPKGHQVMKEKGKVAGFLWMNVGTLNLEHLPNFYALHSTKKNREYIEQG